jgi:hypothetical protein
LFHFGRQTIEICWKEFYLLLFSDFCIAIEIWHVFLNEIVVHTISVFRWNKRHNLRILKFRLASVWVVENERHIARNYIQNYLNIATRFSQIYWTAGFGYAPAKVTSRLSQFPGPSRFQGPGTGPGPASRNRPQLLNFIFTFCR